MPYWEAGAVLDPYSRGYFPADVHGYATVAWMFAAPDIAHYQDFGGHGGDHEGFGDFGGFDGGGGE